MRIEMKVYFAMKKIMFTFSLQAFFFSISMNLHCTNNIQITTSLRLEIYGINPV